MLYIETLQLLKMFKNNFKQYGFINNHDHTKVWQSKFSLKDNIIYQIIMSSILDSYSMLGLTEFSEMNNMDYNILTKENREAFKVNSNYELIQALFAEIEISTLANNIIIRTENINLRDDIKNS